MGVPCLCGGVAGRPGVRGSLGVRIGGPDLDPPVQRDITYILERPTARSYRVAYGTRWIVQNVPHTDFIFYLDDDSFLNVPRLVLLLEALQDQEGRREKPDFSFQADVTTYRNEADRMESLVLGYMMQTDVNMAQSDICQMYFI